ncbi:MAG TPA: T9SS type A sorting domain-containing protein [Bacteroidota bacterium]|nr:T9SS type A sorting domain-containing protein [Bacteroidota bacterium]
MRGRTVIYVTAFTLIQGAFGHSQTTYEVPCNSSNNIFEISVANELGHTIESAELRPVSIPSWLEMSPGFETVSSLPAGTERIVRFHFSVLKSAPVHAAATVGFVVTTPWGERWNKKIALSVSPPVQSVLFQNYPNPFNPETIIAYQLHENAHVQISIYDILGKVVTSLADNEESAGYHEIRWNAADMAGSVYLLHISAIRGNGKKVLESSRKIVILK